MRRKIVVLLGLAMGLVGPAGPARGEAPREDAETRFELRIRPTLAGVCFPCHGGKKTGGGLRVDSRAALVKGGESGPAVLPGDPEVSLLVRALRQSHEAPRMPPGRRLPDPLIAAFADWIRQGAVWPAPARGEGFVRSVGQRHWAFEPLRATEPPAAGDGGAANPIDRFLAARQAAAGLRAVGPADRRTRIRRVTFDLTGLPPTPEECAAFLDDDAPDAYPRLVDRLLASPHYGERWGRHWLDLARYADTAGDNADYPVPELARYRDYVIDAFNTDMPYDRFVREQLAGDLLGSDGPREADAGRVVATGFLALARRYATAPYELWHLTLEDAIDTTGRVFLGLTLRCARCHDHKYDPVTQRDYYALYGVFASTTFPYAGSEEFQSMGRPRQNFAPLRPPDETGPKLKAYREAIREHEARVKEAEAAVAAARGEDRKAEQDRLNARKAELLILQRPGLPADLPGAYAVTEGTPADVPLHRRGDPGDPGPVVPRGVPAFLAAAPPPEIPSHASGRRELAEWLTRPDHPLTARVMVNRIWQHHFGRGLVASASNFGLRGDEPTHPELLDWMAARFVAGGWSIKALHRLIVTSAAYQRSSRYDAANAGKDPANRLLWRFDRRRLDAEALRDAMLAVGGRLDPGRPGGQPFPPIAQWHWTQHDPFKGLYPSNRRSVYLTTQRLQRHPYLALFDGPDPNVSTDVRGRTTVPLQTLYLMNNPFVTECARGLAVRLIAGPTGPCSRVEAALALAWNRPPEADERDRFTAYVRDYSRQLARDGTPPDQVEREAWTSFARVVLTANEFLYVD
jgi:hypothetical protein